MIIKCKKCGETYNVDVSMVGRKVECICGFKWILREPMPTIVPARSLNEEIERISLDDMINSPEKALQTMAKSVKNDYNEYLRSVSLNQELSFKEAYENLKNTCISGNPVPGVFREFFKLCRKQNISDKKEKHFQAVIDRVNLMLALNKKMCRIIWMSPAKKSGVPLKDIENRYCAITVTDRKNLEKCKFFLLHKRRPRP